MINQPRRNQAAFFGGSAAGETGIFVTQLSSGRIEFQPASGNYTSLTVAKTRDLVKWLSELADEMDPPKP